MRRLLLLVCLLGFGAVGLPGCSGNDKDQGSGSGSRGRKMMKPTDVDTRKPDQGKKP